MDFSKVIRFNSALASLLMAALAAAAADPVDSVNPFIGTGGHGHTYPGATTPFGFVQLSPDTSVPRDGWDACAGYHYSVSNILGFSHTHLSGTGIGDLGDVRVMPVAGDIQGSLASAMNSPFSHDNETAQPGYYRVKLDRYNVTAELTATPHAGMHRYTFAQAGPAHIIVDMAHGANSAMSATGATLNAEGPSLLTGSRTASVWAKNRIIYFALESSVPWTSASFATLGNRGPDASAPEGATGITNRGAVARLDFNVTPGTPILLRVGMSPTSVEDAKKNLQAEMPSWDFDTYRQEARAAWNEALGHVEIETQNPNIRQTFYTALYHAMEAPTLYNNADGSYKGPDREKHTGAHFQYYSTFSIWDTHRAEHPLLALVQPERVNDFVNTFLASYQESADHALPMWPLESYETWTMIEDHSVAVIENAYRDGFRGFDTNLALKAMVDTSNCRHYPQEYQTQGYVTPRGRNNAGAATLEMAFDDWCISQFAQSLGQTDIAQKYAGRALNYTNEFDPATGFFRAKSTAGTFRPNFDPKKVDYTDYIEANAWQYTFAVVQDVPGMIALYGGKEKFVSKLDELFTTDSDVGSYVVDVSGILGQYAHGNEPCHHVAYLYDLAGAPYKTQLRAHQIMVEQYDNTPEGICGNDDCGQMSAWYVWSAMGLYPLNPANGVYVIGSPMVQKATLRLDPKFYKGGTFTVIAHDANNQNIYVQSAKLNGETLNHPWITQEQLAAGGTLELRMGILPNKSWGTGE